MTPADMTNAIRGLTDHQKLAVALRCYERLPLSVIAMRMPRQVKVPAVSRLVRRGLDRIRANGFEWDGSRFNPVEKSPAIGLPAQFDLSQVA